MVWEADRLKWSLTRDGRLTTCQCGGLEVHRWSMLGVIISLVTYFASG